MWKCTGCHEKIEDSFEICWNCGTTYQGTADPTSQSELDTPSTHSDPDELTQDVLECPKCRSNKIIPSAEIMDSYREYGSSKIRIKVERDPGALIFRGAELVDLRARVCGECGHVELFVNQPYTLWKAHQARR